MNTHYSLQEWQTALEKVHKLTDKRGMHVDSKIAETVAIMQLIGLNTIMSCSGHVDRITGGPYITFISPEAEKYRKECLVIGDPKDPQYKQLCQKALKANLSEQQKIYPSLEKFYESRTVSFSQRLTLHTISFGACRLYCQGVDLAHTMDAKARNKLLIDNQEEMREFTTYLKKLKILYK